MNKLLKLGALCAVSLIVVGCHQETATCPDGFTECGGKCTSLKYDPTNCGACGTSCGAGLVCSSGSCASSCPAAQAACPADQPLYCADLSHDVLNCGGCASVCLPGQVCGASPDGGAPSCACPAGRPTQCGTGATAECIDTSTDSRNCGACGTACAAGELCSNSRCVASCLSGQTQCPASSPTYCATLTSDRNNCGGCGNV